ncbi:hypothetical protein EON65_36095 [archaeon]|nr:MAG: hypothetical protein EON65_36095 [archaeon]
MVSNSSSSTLPYLPLHPWHQVFYQQQDTLCLSKPLALAICLRAPYILIYRPERTRIFLGALAVTLGLSSEELARIVSTVPRILCLSPSGALLRSLSAIASVIKEEVMCSRALRSDLVDWSCLRPYSAALVQNEENTVPSSLLHSAAGQEEAVLAHRFHPVRSYLRCMVLKNPFILSRGEATIKENLQFLVQYKLPASQLFVVMKKAPALKEKWLQSMEAGFKK